MKEKIGSPVLDAAARLMVPFLILFSLYVLFHGHESPGGGFQSGTILAASVILMRLVRGKDAGWKLTERAALILACGGLFLYAGTGWFAMAFGGEFLNYGVLPLPLEPAQIRVMGTLAVEIGIAAGVFAVMILIFELLSGKP